MTQFYLDQAYLDQVLSIWTNLLIFTLGSSNRAAASQPASATNTSPKTKNPREGIPGGFGGLTK
jgi:hypothetical protein